ncbi:hypothetical protein FOXG_06990 [Fusarium oxysporum f. sp. lycopersici 4287]|uniref:Uncharacterized protein n=2 Tax=Fusarium oxysporum TaxID=5507 RepID=A0A0J9WMV7_FUSO4|nr:hypothetical protein FOXG_06990 [Fusarium oxysporum f. sp. lycopersici 4287]KAJ9419740.1 hypothetical protein QL093DRAFT_2084483 [Fusarium oxysporum]KNB06202.1 hypothetical protein FOXG_06990 [Fusarium oxysporum f. sp. lycopersici 4287]
MSYYIDCGTTSEPDDSLPIANARDWFDYGPVSNVECNQGYRNVVMTINELKFEIDLAWAGNINPGRELEPSARLLGQERDEQGYSTVSIGYPNREVVSSSLLWRNADP